MRPHSRTILPKLVAFAIVVGLSGCAATPDSTPPPPAPSPTAAAAPVFANNDEALAAATEAYAAYLSTADLVTAEGGTNPERIAPFVTAEYLATELAELAEFQELQVRTTGATVFRVTKLQYADYLNPTEVEVAVYICEDVSGLDVIDAEGTSLVASDRLPLTPFEVRFQMKSSILVVSARVPWRGGGVC
ncbi:hypothetical protein [Cryobacterium melibiosiphilum]|nr:hypothetical protein [Cryobacterium melibiosiphilum]